MLNKLCVLTIRVNDMVASIDFYTKVLDFEVSKHYGEDIVSLVHQDVAIILEKAEQEGGREKQNVLPAILSKDLDADIARLITKGATFVFEEPRPCPPGRYTIVEDPSGNQLELIEFSNFTR